VIRPEELLHVGKRVAVIQTSTAVRVVRLGDRPPPKPIAGEQTPQRVHVTEAQAVDLLKQWERRQAELARVRMRASLAGMAEEYGLGVRQLREALYRTRKKARGVTA
jgi:hypothetical protein